MSIILRFVSTFEFAGKMHFISILEAFSLIYIAVALPSLDTVAACKELEQHEDRKGNTKEREKQKQKRWMEVWNIGPHKETRRGSGKHWHFQPSRASSTQSWPLSRQEPTLRKPTSITTDQ